MSLKGLLGFTEELGLRFNLVSVLPFTILFLSVLSLYWSGAFFKPLDLELLAANFRSLDLQGGIFLAIGILVFSVLMQPFQLSLVKLLEGYWGTSPAGIYLTGLGVSRQRRRLKKIESHMSVHDDGETTQEEVALITAKITAAYWRRIQYYPSEDRLLPTALGNALRAGEDTAGERYSLDTISAWPRLYPLLPEKITAILADQRTQLDAACRFCVTFILIALISSATLYKNPTWWLLPAAALVLAWLSYNSAIAAAVSYGKGIHAAFDLHRFDLLEALHHPLPVDFDSEREANARLSRFLKLGEHTGEPEFVYVHGEKKPSEQAF